MSRQLNFMEKHDEWLNSDNPVDKELDKDNKNELLRQLRLEVENLYEEYVDSGLEEDIVITTIREAL